MVSKTLNIRYLIKKWYLPKPKMFHYNVEREKVELKNGTQNLGVIQLWPNYDFCIQSLKTELHHLCGEVTKDVKQTHTYINEISRRRYKPQQTKFEFFLGGH